MTDAEPLFFYTPRVPIAGVTGGSASTAREPGSRMADALRVAATEAAARRAGESSQAFGLSDAAAHLWANALKFDAADPRWPDRDRCVASGPQAEALTSALLQLTGHVGTETIPPADGAEPPGQGLGAAVGLALAERVLAGRFGKSLVDHRTWVLADASELVAGLTHEAICLAGQLRLEKLTVLFEDRGSDGADPGGQDSGGPDRLRHFAAHGWAVKQVDAGDPTALGAAISFALRSKKPSAIACRTRDGAATRAELGWPDAAFGVPAPLRARWRAAGGRGEAARRGWLKRLARHPLRAEFERVTAGRLPEGWREAAAALKAGSLLDRDLRLVQKPPIPELVEGAGCMDAAPEAGVPFGRRIRFGGRTQGMAAAMNGLASHGGVIPCAVTPLGRSDCLRPSLRAAARQRLRAVHVLTDDRDGLGDAPHRFAEQLAGLRAMASVLVLRPADRIEAVECWDLALRRADGPSVLVLSAGEPPDLARPPPRDGCARGGYLLRQPAGPRRATLIAAGPELHAAIRACAILAGRGIEVAVVSLPCWSLFAAQDEAYRERVLGSAPRFGVEAGCGLAWDGWGWDRWLGPDGAVLGAGGPDGSNREITAEAVAGAVAKRLGR
jgi:transketolase